jgi:hypothetical protein
MRKLSVLVLIGLSTFPLLADSNIPLSYIPRKVGAAIQGYVPGAELMKCQIGSNDDWGNTYKCDYVRHGHKGKIKVSEGGRLLDLDENLDPAQIPPGIRRAVAANSLGGMIRKAKLEEDDHRLVYEVEAYYGHSTTKVTLKLTRGGELVGRDYD